MSGGGTGNAHGSGSLADGARAMHVARAAHAMGMRVRSASRFVQQRVRRHLAVQQRGRRVCDDPHFMRRIFRDLTFQVRFLGLTAFPRFDVSGSTACFNSLF
jgi:hypothetical protein